MGTLISIYLVVALLGLAIKYVCRLPGALGFLVLLPAFPFLNAAANWKSKPTTSIVSAILWGILYLMLMLMLALG